MNLDDNDLFRDAMGDVTPLKDTITTLWLKSPSTKAPRKAPDESVLENFLTRGDLEIIPLNTPLEYKADGIQQGIVDKLRRGEYKLDASLNLLRQPVETCRQALFNFMMQAHKLGLRNLLIIHGKGRDDESHANIVRSYLARWLQQFDDVQTFCVAQTRHGGAGALYVGLRKTDKARLENRERHAKRSR
ncbi:MULTISPECIES: DNA endonuclease SmrA [unclassified Pantoea]|uniref:DNA endonuclease SmrA n=1 Tax=unclassified Pantoea TaxID=2630326 RepID=UPI0012326B5B|nr:MULTISPECIES: DNA endonuclease SmrA [unclassified Pantoea]KAA5972178.1 DNA endonuclease SmrA [Pantoea sp. M_6]KAA5977449.1 DNA endonuclease SmrA [Pantoea sp. M_8]KAA5993644.1 DNA endonuclease SmrA [Pantoea sp. M_10]KAA6000574.1 DNA endonuclease SmrA [Pantoea sp. M_5]